MRRPASGAGALGQVSHATVLPAFVNRRSLRPVRSTQQFRITLPNDMADAVRAKVASGEYATESEVIRDGLRALLARDQAIEQWLRDEIAAAYDALKAAPGRAVSAAQVRARLATVRKPATRRS